MVDFSKSLWSYLLGVIHGDGHLSNRSIQISVGYKDQEYADILIDIFKSLGYLPKVVRARSALRIDINNKALTDVFRQYKNDGKWRLPIELDFEYYISGVFDTDGCVANPSNKFISIILKRSGNLYIIKDILTKKGIRDINVKERITRFNGKPYEIEDIKITGMDRILEMNNILHLRHPKKVQRLKEMVAIILEIQSRVPLWKQVSEYLKKEPKTWKDVANEFGLTKKQFDSVIQNIKKECELEVIPPPEPLSSYQVKSQLSSLEK